MNIAEHSLPIVCDSLWSLCYLLLFALFHITLFAIICVICIICVFVLFVIICFQCFQVVQAVQVPIFCIYTMSHNVGAANTMITTITIYNPIQRYTRCRKMQPFHTLCTLCTWRRVETHRLQHTWIFNEQLFHYWKSCMVVSNMSDMSLRSRRWWKMMTFTGATWFWHLIGVIGVNWHNCGNFGNLM